jgi:2-polyprenyl-6-methoxyphenol hydroxylase-like FAD-dependent oxidoreductase
MKVAVVGAGPAGLFFSLLLRRKRPDAEVTVYEQNARDATFGFGVVFSRGALEFLARDEPQMHARLAAAMEAWPMQRIVHRDTAVDIDGNGFSALGRLALLEILQAECRAAGVELVFEKSLSAIPPGDVVVGADGVNSVVRKAFENQFKPKIEHLTNKFAWYGTRQRFECLTLTFRENEHGAWVAHHYRYSPEMSTFIVECTLEAWQRAGLDRMGDAESRAYCERVFAADLGGHPLISNKSVWRNFPLLANGNYFAGNTVLIGDALRTGHFSIGSGTRLAFDDAIALSRVFEDPAFTVGQSLAKFEAQRRPIVEKIVAAANRSSYWYETFPARMKQGPWQLAYDYMTRSGRMTDERLRAEAPAFYAGLARSGTGSGPARS